MQAISIIADAFERCNRLSPGEVLNDDDAASGFRRLNKLVDELSAKNLFLYQSILTSAAQTGHITLGAGSWAAIAPGAEIVGATANNNPLSRLTMQQYNNMHQPTVTGLPSFYAQDGLSTVYLWPVPVGQTIQLLTGVGVAAFADQTTEYILPPGYEAALGAALAVRIAPNLLGTVPQHLKDEAAKCMSAISNYDPAIVDVGSFTNGRGCYPPRLF